MKPTALKKGDTFTWRGRVFVFEQRLRAEGLRPAKSLCRCLDVPGDDRWIFTDYQISRECTRVDLPPPQPGAGHDDGPGI